MNALSELELPTRAAGSGAATTATQQQDKIPDKLNTGRALYQYLDIYELFDQFTVRLSRQVVVNQICLDNSSLGIELSSPAGRNVGLSGEFMLRYALQYEGQQLGNLTIRRNRQFLSTEVRRVQHSVDSLLGPLCNAIKYRQVWRSAYHDALTGILNRASLDLLLSGEERRQPAALIVCDLDHFKSINDHYGHSAGDAVLREFVRILSQCVGQYGAVYRYGGDEFVIILHKVPADGGFQIAENIRQSVMDNELLLEGRAIKMTTTIGLTRVGDDEPLDEAFLRADSALLDGKRKNRNVVICA